MDIYKYINILLHYLKYFINMVKSGFSSLIGLCSMFSQTALIYHLISCFILDCHVSFQQETISYNNI